MPMNYRETFEVAPRNIDEVDEATAAPCLPSLSAQTERESVNRLGK